MLPDAEQGPNSNSCLFPTHLERLRLRLLSLERERLLWAVRELSLLGHNLCGGLLSTGGKKMSQTGHNNNHMITAPSKY